VARYGSLIRTCAERSADIGTAEAIRLEWARQTDMPLARET
jgi:hypothetical protein